MKKLLFTKSAIPLIVGAFGKVVSGDGIIKDHYTLQPVTDMHGKVLTLDNFGGVININGEVVFVANDLLGVIDIVDNEMRKK